MQPETRRSAEKHVNLIALNAYRQPHGRYIRDIPKSVLELLLAMGMIQDGLYSWHFTGGEDNLYKITTKLIEEARLKREHDYTNLTGG